MDTSMQRGLQFMRTLRHELETGKLVLPAFPDVAMRVRTALGNPYVTVPKVVSIVSTEPVLTARLLKMANSALVAVPGSPAKDVQTAISRLGFTMVRNAAMAVAMEQMMAAKSMGPLKGMLKAVWQHSVQVAAMAFVIARHTRVVPPDDALLAGLLHDMGKFYILQRADASIDAADEQMLMMEDLLEKWHAVVGHTLLRSWNFPADIVAAVEQHEQLDRRADKADLADVVLVANLHANIKKPRKGRTWDTISAFERLSLTPEQSTQLMNDARARIAEVQKALSNI